MKAESPLRSEADIVAARQLVRRLTQQVGLSLALGAFLAGLRGAAFFAAAGLAAGFPAAASGSASASGFPPALTVRMLAVSLSFTLLMFRLPLR